MANRVERTDPGVYPEKQGQTEKWNTLMKDAVAVVSKVSLFCFDECLVMFWGLTHCVSYLQWPRRSPRDDDDIDQPVKKRHTDFPVA